MSKINLSERDVQKLIFIYDNGRPYVAAGVNKVEFNNEDIDNNHCIQYSQNDGTVSIVYTHDLAAITAYYEDAICTVKLLPCAVIDGGAHIKMSNTKGDSPLTNKEKADNRLRKIENSIARYTSRMRGDFCKSNLKPRVRVDKISIV